MLHGVEGGGTDCSSPSVTKSTREEQVMVEEVDMDLSPGCNGTSNTGGGGGGALVGDGEMVDPGAQLL